MKFVFILIFEQLYNNHNFFIISFAFLINIMGQKSWYGPVWYDTPPCKDFLDIQRNYQL